MVKRREEKTVWKVMTKFIKTIVMALWGMLVAIPIVLSPFVTSVPPIITLILGAVYFGVIIVSFRRIGRNRGMWLMAGGLLILLLTVAASQIWANTPDITDEKGRPLTNSIATLEKVNLNGSQQWITIRGKDKSKPVLLYLGIGGPGAGGFPATFTSLKLLEDDFVVVNWDQPGTGKSYKARDISNLTPQVVIDDARALSEMLIKRFGQKKIYLMGLSWGTIVGTELVRQNPELFYAYVGNGQMVNTTENDRYGYNLAVKLMEEKGDTRRVNKLKSYGPPPYSDKNMGIKFADYNNVLFDHMGSPNIWTIMALVPQFAREYGYVDKLYFNLGLIRSFQRLYPQLNDLDFIKQAPKLAVPMYFLVGEKDVNAVASIVDRYYQVLEAPHKELIWVKSGHGATAEEIEETFVDRVLVKSPPQ